MLILVLILPFNFRYIFNFSATKDFLFFKENLQYSLYFFDLLFLIIFSSWIFQKIKAKTIQKFLESKWLIFLLIVYLIWNVFSVSSNSSTSTYNFLRLFEVLFFFLIFIDTVKTKKFFNQIVYLIFLSGIFQSVLALGQFIFQKSLGLKYLGESVLNPQILGVAKIEVNSEKFIRGYGTFPHPNILGAFLFLSLITSLYFILNKNCKIPFSTPSIFNKFKLNSKSKLLSEKIHFGTGLLLISAGILVTFSRSIWLITAFSILILSLSYFKYFIKHQNLLRSSSKYLFPILILLLILFISFYKFVPTRLCTSNCRDQSFSLRTQYSDFSKKEILHNNCWTGIGIGQFSIIFNNLNPANLPTYHIQPVHNLYLLIWSEIGLFGLVLLILIIKNNFQTFIVSSKQKLFILLVSGFLLLGFFDHYFWTLPQGQFIFWLTLALLLTSGKIKDSI